jgi:hypothetical protein
MLEINAGIVRCELPIGFGVVFAVFFQAAISLIKAFLSEMRRSRHWVERPGPRAKVQIQG